MPGSLRYFAYFDDASVERFAHLDESIAESTDLGFGQSVTSAVYSDYANRVYPSKKVPIQMRYILASRVNQDGRRVTRKFQVGAVSAPAWGATTRQVSVDSLTWDITAKIGEQRFLPPGQDSGLIDGDTETNITAAA